MPVINEDIDLPGGANPSDIIVEVFLADTAGRGVVGFTATKTYMGSTAPPVNANGTWTLTLLGNIDIVQPTDTVYRRIIRSNGTKLADDLFDVPVGGGPYNLVDRLL